MVMPEIRNMNLTQGQKEFDRRQKKLINSVLFWKSQRKLGCKK